MAVGRVSGLWRYPVKSMQGEPLAAAEVSERGFAGDRAYAFVDSLTGKIASAKNPRKWPGLLHCTVAYVAAPAGAGDPPAIRVRFPDGTEIASSESDFNFRASSLLGREVVLRSVPVESPSLEEYWPDIDGLAYRETVTEESMSGGMASPSFFDSSAIHLVTTSTLASLSQAHPAGRFEPWRFRPNLLIDATPDGFPENDWVGHRLRVGAEVVLNVLVPCARCVMTTLPQRDLPLDHGILRAVAVHNHVMIAPLGRAMPSVGVYAQVLHGGRVLPGDPVAVMD